MGDRVQDWWDASGIMPAAELICDLGEGFMQFLLIILNHIIQRFLHTLFPIAARPPTFPAPVLSAVFSYPQSGGWQWQIEERQSSISTWLEGQIITGYFPLLLKSPTYSCRTTECIKAFSLRRLWIAHCLLLVRAQCSTLLDQSSIWEQFLRRLTAKPAVLLSQLCIQVCMIYVKQQIYLL